MEGYINLRLLDPIFL